MSEQIVLVRTFLYSKVIGSTHHGEAFSFDYDLPNDTIYAETCASIGLIFFAQRMLQIEPNREYADVIERALYNNVIGSMSKEEKHYFYINLLELVINGEAKILTDMIRDGYALIERTWQPDNQAPLASMTLLTDNPLTVSFDPNLLGGTTVIEGEACETSCHTLL